MRILYVEDNEYLRESIAELLAAPGREVLTCASGEQAVALWEQAPFDVLVTDVSLPGMSGTALARRLLQAKPDQWVVLCTGYDFGRDAQTLGSNVRSMVKPFEADDLDALMQRIEASLGGQPAA